MRTGAHRLPACVPRQPDPPACLPACLPARLEPCSGGGRQDASPVAGCVRAWLRAWLVACAVRRMHPVAHALPVSARPPRAGKKGKLPWWGQSGWATAARIITTDTSSSTTTTTTTNATNATNATATHGGKGATNATDTAKSL